MKRAEAYNVTICQIKVALSPILPFLSRFFPLVWREKSTWKS